MRQKHQSSKVLTQAKIISDLNLDVLSQKSAAEPDFGSFSMVTSSFDMSEEKETPPRFSDLYNRSEKSNYLTKI